MNQHYKFINPPLPYAYNALEPFIDAKTMELHHDRHLQTYVDNLNNILKDYPEYQDFSLEELIIYADSLPDAIKIPILRNAGGVYNHIFFFSILQNPSTQEPPQPFLQFISSAFENFEEFKQAFTEKALSVFGSGYAWLVLDAFNNLKIITTANQKTPLTMNLCPILCIDVWEHAYYLKHYNKRADYINDWFHVINWNQASQNLLNCFSYYG
ncbi:MAG: superoxide dismutase [Eubacterium sp.]